jgi:hypothetical protein
LKAWIEGKMTPLYPPFWRDGLLGVVGAALLFLHFFAYFTPFTGRRFLPDSLRQALSVVQPFELVNFYGAFAVMTRERPEIIIEGSDDGVTWKEYEFKYKPGDVKRPPVWAAPHQPRLDWQMWFAALGSPRVPFWFERLVQSLLENNRDVTRLLQNNPFPDRPPHYVRASLYQYQFTVSFEHAVAGHWWKRQYQSPFVPQISLEH